MNFKFSMTKDVSGRTISKSHIVLVLMLSLFVASCAKKPAQLYDDGMKAFAAGEYDRAQEDFADGIKKEGGAQFYSGFIAANLVTGKYPQINSAYNQLSDKIHSSLVALYGKNLFLELGIAKELIPYNVNGANQVPPDFPETIGLQAKADYEDYLAIEQEIDNLVKK